MVPRHWLKLIICALLVCTAAPAGAQERVDVRIATELGRQIERYPQLTIFDDVNGHVDEGVVTLTGKVTMPFKKTDIGRKAATIAGVRGVANNIDVLPVSPFDEELRLKVARAIYGNSAF